MEITWYTTLSGDMQWSDYVNGNSDPLGDIRDAVVGIRKRFRRQPNFIKTSNDVLRVFMGHSDIVEYVPIHTNSKDISVNLMCRTILKCLFGIKEIEIDNTMKDRMLIAYKENNKIYPDSNTMYEIRGIL